MSRARFYDLIGQGVFPPPLYLLANKRPFYSAELQRQCREIRSSGIGWNGQPTIFYSARKTKPRSISNGAKPTAAQSGKNEYLKAALTSLGIAGVDDKQVDAALASCFPSGTEGKEQGVVIQAVFRHLKGSTAPDKHSR